MTNIKHTKNKRSEGESESEADKRPITEPAVEAVHDFSWKDGQTGWMTSKFELAHHLSEDSHRPIHW